ncbi:ribonuclease [Mycetohabitans endofungorum]|uniref:RraA family protein n=1 Tax=Mycetohabitans endofungorum TaxID=417203 RepID=UPI000959D5C0|nr:regulator of ribonuclease activity A [Burkholderia sp. b14]
MTTFATPDLCDAHEDSLATGMLHVLASVFRAFGRASTFAGPASTLKVFEDNTLVRAALEEKARGGGWWSAAAAACVARSSAATSACSPRNMAGVASLSTARCGTHASWTHAKSAFARLRCTHSAAKNRGISEWDVAVAFPSVTIRRGEICREADGVLISTTKLT